MDEPRCCGKGRVSRITSNGTAETYGGEVLGRVKEAAASSAVEGGMRLTSMLVKTLLGVEDIVALGAGSVRALLVGVKVGVGVIEGVTEGAVGMRRAVDVVGLASSVGAEVAVALWPTQKEVVSSERSARPDLGEELTTAPTVRLAGLEMIHYFLIVEELVLALVAPPIAILCLPAWHFELLRGEGGSALCFAGAISVESRRELIGLHTATESLRGERERERKGEREGRRKGKEASSEI